MGIWIAGTSNQLFIRGPETETKLSKKQNKTKQLLAKFRSL